jgi:hypothetical protein
LVLFILLPDFGSTDLTLTVFNINIQKFTTAIAS